MTPDRWHIINMMMMMMMMTIIMIFLDRLNQLRQQKLYPFADKGGLDNHGDFQKDIRDTMPQINKQVMIMIMTITRKKSWDHIVHDKGELLAPFHGFWVQLHLALTARAYLLQVLTQNVQFWWFFIIVPSPATLQSSSPSTPCSSRSAVGPKMTTPLSSVNLSLRRTIEVLLLHICLLPDLNSAH